MQGKSERLTRYMNILMPNVIKQQYREIHDKVSVANEIPTVRVVTWVNHCSSEFDIPVYEGYRYARREHFLEYTLVDLCFTCECVRVFLYVRISRFFI